MKSLKCFIIQTSKCYESSVTLGNIDFCPWTKWGLAKRGPRDTPDSFVPFFFAHCGPSLASSSIPFFVSIQASQYPKQGKNNNRVFIHFNSNGWGKVSRPWSLMRVWGAKWMENPVRLGPACGRTVTLKVHLPSWNWRAPLSNCIYRQISNFAVYFMFLFLFLVQIWHRS